MLDEVEVAETTEVEDEPTATEVLDEVVLDEVEFKVRRIPPRVPPGGEVLVVAFLARAANASRVLPVVGLYVIRCY
jgi:hypothetical protein